MALTLFCASCSRHPVNSGNTPLVHNAEIDIWPDSIDFHTGMILRAEGDSALSIRVEGNALRTIPLPPTREGGFSFSSGFPLLDALYRLDDAKPKEGWWRFSPYELYLDPLNAREGTELLATRLKHGYIVPPETRRYEWPVINDNGMWLLAACELFKTGGDRRWLETIGETAAKVIGEDCLVARNPATGLFFGIPRYMAGAENLFPGWMTPSYIFATQSLAVNAAYWSALDAMNSITADMARKNEKSHLPELPVDADSLQHAINREFWMPNLGCYSALVYGSPLNPLQLHSSDNLAQGVAAATGLTSVQIGKAMIRNTPLAPLGISPFTPHPSRNAPFADTSAAAAAFWAVAAAHHGSTQTYETSIGALLYLAAAEVLDRQPSPRRTFRNSMAGLILRGFLGMKFAFDGIWIAPSVPGSIPGTKHLRGLKYRRATLDITLRGTGRAIGSFTIDGKPASPFIPSSLEGRHEIEISMADDPAPSSPAPLPDDGATLPPPPLVEWASAHEAAVLPQPENTAEGGTHRKNVHPTRHLPASYAEFVYLNGVLTDELATHTYRIPEMPHPATVQFVSVENSRLAGFSAEPRLYIPHGSMAMVYLATVARGGTRIIEDSKLAARFVESSRGRNSKLEFDYSAPHDGEYLIDVHYISGLGIVNPRRRTALRSLYIDGTRRGIFVFPQQTPGNTEPASNGWQNLTAFSNPLKVFMHKGENRISIRLYQPTPVYIDPTSNTIVADFVRITAL